MKSGDMIKFSGFCLYREESGQTIWEISAIDRSGIVLQVVDTKIEVYSAGRIYLLDQTNIIESGDTAVEHL